MTEEMSIKEVEQELGITRATVRFYEKNGLIKPDRKHNTYRVYTTEDVAELRRIVILRKLGFSVADIQGLAHGDRDLQEALEGNVEKLNEELIKIKGAIRMCQRLQDEKTNLMQLGEEKYWEALEEEEEKGNLFMNIAKDTYHYGRHTFLDQFGLEDCNGDNLESTKGTIKRVLITCVICGLVYFSMDMLVDKDLSWESFKEGFWFPVELTVFVFFLGLPFYFIGKKRKVLGKRLKIGAIIVVIFLLVCLVLINL